MSGRPPPRKGPPSRGPPPRGNPRGPPRSPPSPTKSGQPSKSGKKVPPRGPPPPKTASRRPPGPKAPPRGPPPAVRKGAASPPAGAPNAVKKAGRPPAGRSPPPGAPPAGRSPPPGAPPAGRSPPPGAPPAGRSPPPGAPPRGRRPPAGPRGVPSKAPPSGRPPPPRGIARQPPKAPPGKAPPRGPPARASQSLPRSPSTPSDGNVKKRVPPPAKSPPTSPKRAPKPKVAKSGGPPPGRPPPGATGATRVPPPSEEPPSSMSKKPPPPNSKPPPVVAPPGKPPPPNSKPPPVAAPPGKPPPPSLKPPSRGDAYDGAEEKSAQLAASIGPPASPPPTQETESSKPIPGPPRGLPPPPKGKPKKSMAPVVGVVPPPPKVPPAPKIEAPWEPPSGRIVVTVMRARELTTHTSSEKEQGIRLNPYVTCKVGPHLKAAPTKKTATFKKTTKNPEFMNQQIVFNIFDPQVIIKDNQIQMFVEVWNDKTFKDQLLGNVMVPLKRVLNGKMKEQWFKLGCKVKGLDKDQPSGEIQMRIEYFPSRKGLMVVTVHEGRDLANKETFGKQDPYCKFTLGDKFKLKGKTIKNGGINPYFREEEFEFWIDNQIWSNDMLLQLYDEDVGSDDFIGQATFPILPYLMSNDTEELVVDLFDKSKKAGEVRLSFNFFPAGVLTVNLKEGRHLLSEDIGRQDPYIKFTLPGHTFTDIKKSKVDTDGGEEPVWNEEFKFDIVDQYDLKMECFDKDTFTSDDAIGHTQMSLLPIFKKGVVENWVPIYKRTKWGAQEKAGEIKLIFDFEAPAGVFYPQRRPDLASFDERDRRNKKQEELDAKIQAAKDLANEQFRRNQPLEALQGDIAAKEAQDSEFTDKEIRDAFKFIDLNNNSFVSAGEIRHILICMGELITDEEIDEMIRMVDLDGDGQVSFDEFYRMAKDPDPSRPGFNDISNRPATNQINGVPPPPPPPGAPNTSQAGVASRAADVQRKQDKKRFLEKFVKQNDCLPQTLSAAFKRYQMLKEPTGLIAFEEWLKIMNVEFTGEYRHLFDLFDHEDIGKINIRNFLLGLSNFTSNDYKLKTKFVFDLFDEDRNGFLVIEELVKVLQANHLVSDESAVMRKAQTIMKQADKDNDNRISPSEFEVIAKKFPNILFPSST